ncbi:MAG TPA: hypothetical protein VLN26_10870 [Gaiellaceae bacterium]|nr:hypothetical protein [Gaiellaceae bacterium]
MSRHLTEVLLLAALAAAVVLLWPRTHRVATPYYADAALTPGALNPAVTQATIGSTICVAGWTRTIRPPADYTGALKLRQMRDYDAHGPPTAFQEDHLISLELGGAPTDPRNLWPQPRPWADEVDRTENRLREEVCSGCLSLAEAQRRESALKHGDN